MRTAECVTPRHPDKMCDQISDAVLDWALSKDPFARVAMESMGGHGAVYLAGEVSIKGFERLEGNEEFGNMLHNVVRKVTGRADLELHFRIASQSSEIANGVDTGGAGDQGIMVGYACRDNEAMIPQEEYLSRKLAQYIYAHYPYDGKTQITLDSDGDVETIVASFQNAIGSSLKILVNEWIDNENVQCSPNLKIYTNPAGDWFNGGFDADTGLTGRKLMVDNYGPQVAIGGGAFSGKDATKVDRSAAYMARRIAVDYLKLHEDAKEALVKLAYAIGVAEPVMATVQVDGGEIVNVNRASYDLTPKGIIDFLDLRKPQFEETAKWGHFGNGFKWD